MNLAYFKSLLDKTDPTASLKHGAYALVVFMSCVWLTYHLAMRGMDATWVAAYTVLVGAVALTKVKSDEPQGPIPKP